MSPVSWTINVIVEINISLEKKIMSSMVLYRV